MSTLAANWKRAVLEPSLARREIHNLAMTEIEGFASTLGLQNEVGLGFQYSSFWSGSGSEFPEFIAVPR